MMTTDEFEQLVREMRVAQKRYFAIRHSATKQKWKEDAILLERRVDSYLLKKEKENANT